MKHPHRHFIHRVNTRDGIRLLYNFDKDTGEYTIRLESFYIDVWQDEGFIVMDTNFTSIEAVWVWLLKQDTSIWIRAQRYLA